MDRFWFYHFHEYCSLRFFLYVAIDSAMRPNKVFVYRIGSGIQPKLIFQENDDLFYVDVIKSRNQRFAFITVNSKTSSENYLISLDNSNFEPKIIQKRNPNVVYFVEQHENDLIILTNADGAYNFKVMMAPLDCPRIENWKELVGESSSVAIADMLCLEVGLFLFYENSSVVYYPWNHFFPNVINFPLHCSYGEIRGGINEFNCKNVRFIASSLIDNEISFDFNPIDSSLHQISSLSKANLDMSVMQLEATSLDGEKIPVTLLHSKSSQLNGTRPVIWNVYGAYGHKLPMHYDCTREVLLKRDWVYAFAHVRGGGEKGRRWHDSGRLLNKRNSFYDFTACVNLLHDKKWSTPSKTAALASSAGGLVLGAHANFHGDSLIRAMIGQNPFIDLIGSMSDPAKPLTKEEYEEWGDPSVPHILKYLKSYAPLENIKKQSYPHVLAFGSEHDIQVPFSDPLQWVITLRENNTNPDRLAFLDMKDGVGHFGDTSNEAIIEHSIKIFTFLSHTLQEPL